MAIQNRTKKFREFSSIPSFTFLLLFFLLFISTSVEAKKDGKKLEKQLQAPQDGQPYVHQWFETKTKDRTGVFGQVYRPRKDLVVLEMIPNVEEESLFGGGRKGSERVGLGSGETSKPEVTAVRIKTKDGKVYEAQMRKVPMWFMPAARKNFQSSEANIQSLQAGPAPKK